MEPFFVGWPKKYLGGIHMFAYCDILCGTKFECYNDTLYGTKGLCAYYINQAQNYISTIRYEDNARQSIYL